MPLDNIDRAIKKGSGEGADAALLEEVTYEGYGPGGAAILVQALTDNRNRTVAEVRSVFTRQSGSLGEAGSVSWLFDNKGIISLRASEDEADDLALIAIDAGAEDVQVEDGTLEVQTPPDRLEEVRTVLAEQTTVESAELSMVPKTVVSLDEKTAIQTLRLLDHLEELDDVQRVYSNAEFPDEVLARLAG
jgi:YebC/PmpR family DNA-binding regulatory protein